MNKYRKWHDQIIERATGRELLGNFERHHIKPKCLDGSNEKSNIVKLTYREHFLVHWLLTKFIKGKGKGKMLYALNMMTRKADKSSWQYDVGRRAVVKAATGRKATLSTKKKLSESRAGKKPSLGLNHSLESKKLISKSLKLFYENNIHTSSGKRLSQKCKNKIAVSVRRSYEFGISRQKMTERKRGKDGRWTKSVISETFAGNPLAKNRDVNRERNT